MAEESGPATTLEEIKDVDVDDMFASLAKKKKKKKKKRTRKSRRRKVPMVMRKVRAIVVVQRDCIRMEPCWIGYTQV